MHSAPTTVRNRTFGSGRPHFWRVLHAEWSRISSLNHDVKPLGPIFVQKSGRFPPPLHAMRRNPEVPRDFARSTRFHAVARGPCRVSAYRTEQAVRSL